MLPPGLPAIRFTLQLRPPFGRTLGLALTILLISWGGLEIFVRQPIVSDQLPGPSVGAMPYVDLKLARLKLANATRLPINCFIVGSSMTMSINPVLVSQAYTAQSPTPLLSCFNFGIPGLNAISTAWFVEFLIHEYHPILIIFGTDARDYVPQVRGDFPTREHLFSPWMESRLGRLTWQGWLVDHSLSYQYLLVFCQWLQPDFDQYLAEMYQLSADNDGYPIFALQDSTTPITRSSVDLTHFPDPQQSAGELGLFTTLADYEVAPENLNSLSAILDQQRPNTQVVVVQMPTHPTYMGLFTHGDSDYQKFVAVVSQTVIESGEVWWGIEVQPAIPSDGWYDRNHLNARGSQAFSIWLGQQLSHSVRNGLIQLPR